MAGRGGIYGDMYGDGKPVGSPPSPTPTDEAFERYCRDPVIAHALFMAEGDLPKTLLRTAFAAGAQYAISRCKAEGH